LKSKFGPQNVITLLFLVVEETLKGNTVKLLGPKKRAGKRIGGADLGLPKVRRNALIEIISVNTGCLNSCTYWLVLQSLLIIVEINTEANVLSQNF
jgi:hypothetical protein